MRFEGSAQRTERRLHSVKVRGLNRKKDTIMFGVYLYKTKQNIEMWPKNGIQSYLFFYTKTLILTGIFSLIKTYNNFENQQ